MKFVEEFYEGNIKKNIEKRDSLSSKVNIIGISRLVILLIWAVDMYYLYVTNKMNLMFISTVFFIGLFIVVAYYHEKLFQEKRISEILIEVNQNGLKRLNGEFKSFEDDGSEYLDDNHPFINDLDIFGHNSLFQFINTTVTQGGRNNLVSLLKQNKKLNKDEITEKQEAIKELGQKAEWRQNLIVAGSLKKSKSRNLDKLIAWTNEKREYEPLRTVIAMTFIAVTISSIFLVLKNVLPESFLVLVLMINFCVVKMLSKGIRSDIQLFESIKKDIDSYSKILELIEDERFEGKYINKLRNNLTLGSVSCKKEMKNLAAIVEWMGDSSYNAFYFFINILVFSDVFLVRRLQKWRERNGERLEKWLEVMHEVDALCSIANIAFDHEKWIYPQISNENVVEGINIGHPLIGTRAVTNTFSIKNEQKAALVTGSNMSGKSTFLRTIGVNLILSYIGAPVFAEEFKCGIMSVYTCMRTKDNLEESISSFYAEILRIKILIESCKKGENVFFLLDEIFKGTNSMDRHTGAKILIEQLIKYGAIGIVSTHDLELCDLDKKDNSIVNYNFREFYENNNIKFDYILRKGKSETRNAIHLMKLAGIEIK